MDNNLVIRQLKGRDHIDYNNLVRISELIYDTDPYIYPCIFSTREEAMQILPVMFQQGDDIMFHLNNCYVAEYEGIIVGLILWHKGPLDWDAHSLCTHATASGISLSPHLPLVRTQYFESYRAVATDTISLINICVNKHFQNRGICKQLLKSFISKHIGEKMELYVLSDNYPAKRVYASVGFQSIRTIQGFSLDKDYILCDQMILLGQK